MIYPFLSVLAVIVVVSSFTGGAIFGANNPIRVCAWLERIDSLAERIKARRRGITVDVLRKVERAKRLGQQIDEKYLR